MWYYMTPVGIIWVKQQSLSELLLTKLEFKEAIDQFQIIQSVFCLAKYLWDSGFWKYAAQGRSHGVLKMSPYTCI